MCHLKTSTMNYERGTMNRKPVVFSSAFRVRRLSNRVDLNRRVVLPVALRALVLLAALPLEDDDLAAAAVIDHGARHLHALDRGRADLHAAFAADADER